MELNTALSYLNGVEKVPDTVRKQIKRWRDTYYGISLHTSGACPRFKKLSGGGGYIEPANYFGKEYQDLFDNFIFSRHPRENELTREWRYSVYRPLTRAPFQQIIDVVKGAIFQDSNYALEIHDEDDSEYIWGNNFEGYDLMGYFANVGIQSIMEDPNGLFVRMPSKPYYEVSEKKVPIAVFFVKSKDIIYKDNESLLFKRDNYAFLIDLNSIWRFTYDISTSKYAIGRGDERGYYATMFDKLPVSVAGGIWNTQGFFDSYLQNAKPVADEFISSYSAEQLIDKESSHPYIQMVEQECPSCRGIGDVTEVVEIDGEDKPFMKKCGACHGKGTISYSPGDRIMAPKQDMDRELVKIINPDVSINQYHHAKNNNIYERMLHALNLYRTDKAESGEAKAIDQERLYQFIISIINHLFDKIIYESIRDIIAYRHVSSVGGYNSPSVYPFGVIKPTQLQIKTAADLLSEFKEGKDAGMPVFVRNRMVYEFIDKQYSGDTLMRKKAEIILAIDDLSVRTEDEKLTMRTSGDISKEDLLLSRKLPGILDLLVRNNGEKWLIDSPFATVEAAALSEFKKIKPDTYFTDTDDTEGI